MKKARRHNSRHLALQTSRREVRCHKRGG
jgi:hypothetical protein